MNPSRSSTLIRWLWGSLSVLCLVAVGAMALSAAGLDSKQAISAKGLTTSPAETVVFLHGLARGNGTWLVMDRRFRDAGFETMTIRYHSTKKPFDTLSVEVAAEFDTICADAEESSVHVVAHSLGGILLRDAWREGAPSCLGRVVMLSPPNSGSEIIDMLDDAGLVSPILGKAAQELGTDEGGPSRFGKVEFEVGVITGNATVNPILSQVIPGPDDGKVSVASARVEGMRDFLVVPYSHTFIANSVEVFEQSKNFLKHGRFLESDTVENPSRD